MHPYIAYALIAFAVIFVVGGIVQWRRSASQTDRNRSFRHTFDDSTPRR